VGFAVKGVSLEQQIETICYAILALSSHSAVNVEMEELEELKKSIDVSFLIFFLKKKILGQVFSIQIFNVLKLQAEVPNDSGTPLGHNQRVISKLLKNIETEIRLALILPFCSKL
jgi:hypothetical protein